MSDTADLQTIADQFGRYPVDAYILLGEGLRKASRALGRDRASGGDRHLDACEVVDGVLDLASDRYGLLAQAVLESWNIYQGSDLGAITFQLIEHGILGKQPGDREDDFHACPEFAATLRHKVQRDVIQELL